MADERVRILLRKQRSKVSKKDRETSVRWLHRRRLTLVGVKPLCAARQHAGFRVPQVGYDIYVIPDDVLTIVLTFGVLMPIYL